MSVTIRLPHQGGPLQRQQYNFMTVQAYLSLPGIPILDASDNAGRCAVGASVSITRLPQQAGLLRRQQHAGVPVRQLPPVSRHLGRDWHRLHCERVDTNHKVTDCAASVYALACVHLSSGRIQYKGHCAAFLCPVALDWVLRMCHLFPVIWGETGTGFTVSGPCRFSPTRAAQVIRITARFPSNEIMLHPEVLLMWPKYNPTTAVHAIDFLTILQKAVKGIAHASGRACIGPQWQSLFGKQ